MTSKPALTGGTAHGKETLEGAGSALSPAREMPVPAGLPARITFPARRTYGTWRLLLAASTAMKRHRGFCQKTKRQRQSWGWGKLRCPRGSLQRQQDAAGLHRCYSAQGGTRLPGAGSVEGEPAPLPSPGSAGWEVLEGTSQAQDNSWPHIPPGWLCFMESCVFAPRGSCCTSLLPGEGALSLQGFATRES